MFPNTIILLLEINSKEVIRDANNTLHVRVTHCTIIYNWKNTHPMFSNLGMLSKCWSSYMMEYHVDIKIMS